MPRIHLGDGALAIPFAVAICILRIRIVVFAVGAVERPVEDLVATDIENRNVRFAR